jgi:hypothetical protein
MIPARLLWAARDVTRHPVAAVTAGLAVTLLAALLTAVLLMAEGLAQNAARALAGAPALVVRRATPAGWAPMPAETARRSAAPVPGVTGVHPRIWGRVTCQGLPVTLVGLDGADAYPLPPGNLSLGEGQVLVMGTGGLPAPGERLTLDGASRHTLTVAARLDPPLALAVPPLVVATAQDARRVLGLHPGQVTDLALEVFQTQEAAALVPDLARAFPWPVEILRREDVLQAYRRAAADWSTGRLVLWLPALAALALLTAAGATWTARGREEVGLLKALGWSTAQITGHLAACGLVVSLPAAVAGLALGMAGMAGGGPAAIALWLTGWDARLPLCFPDAPACLAACLQAALLVLLPYLGGTLGAALRLSAAEPVDLLQGDG